jgi:hypothetical protein
MAAGIMSNKSAFVLFCLLGIALVGNPSPARAGYKARTWNMGTRESYPSKLVSEGVTIAADPLFTDVLASQVFDKNDIVTRGIMPLAIIIFNDNDYPVDLEGMSIELTADDKNLRTLMPNEVVFRLFSNDRSWLSKQIPIPQVPKSRLNQEALNDFDAKFLATKTVAPHDKAGGFLYFDTGSPKDLASDLKNAIVYIPNIYRGDNGSRLIFFEIELSAAIEATPRR